MNYRLRVINYPAIPEQDSFNLQPLIQYTEIRYESYIITHAIVASIRRSPIWACRSHSVRPVASDLTQKDSMKPRPRVNTDCVVVCFWTCVRNGLVLLFIDLLDDTCEVYIPRPNIPGLSIKVSKTATLSQNNISVAYLTY